ncbi:MAG: hypothetical protein IJW09_07365 [Clostridia bacterium]|nr:hypothetical protein [Clostridia bacterium]
MKNGKLNTWRKGLTFLSLFIAILCVCVTPTMARYLTTGSAVATFAIKAQQQVYWHDPSAQTDGEFSLSEGKMQFLCVSNANADESVVADDDITFRIRFYLNETVQAKPDMTFSMQSKTDVNDDYTPQILASKITLDENSALAKLSGKGSVYMFLDANKQEMLFTLKGGVLSDYYFVFVTDDVKFNNFQMKVEIVDMPRS